jgi:hypothetical protein
MIHHIIRLRSPQHYGANVPPEAFGEILRGIPDLVRRAILMGFEGRSAVRRRPRWLETAADLRFVQHEGADETILHLEAPTFGEAAEELYQQQEFWPSQPEPDLTGLDLLGDLIEDVRADRTDSLRFDRPLLTRLTRFGKSLRSDYTELLLTGHRYATDSPARFDDQAIRNARRFGEITPQPQRVRIVGTLDMLRASTQSFAVKLAGGDEVRGGWPSGDVRDLHDLLNRDVLVVGKAVYRPSGELLRVDASDVRSANGEAAMWSHVPAPRKAPLDLTSLRKRQGPRSGLAAIIGRWPGDETDDEVARALEDLS